MDTQTIERCIMRNAKEFSHPVLGVHVDEATREVFIFDTLAADLQTPASGIRYVLDGDLDTKPTADKPIPFTLRPWREGDADSSADEPETEEMT